MKVKLIQNPWISDEFPNGLTLNKEYKLIERFNSNSYDEYFRIIDDNNDREAWHSDCFEVVEEECEYCSKDNTEDNLRCDDGIIIDKNKEVYIFAEHCRNERVRITNVKYCPMCGKKL